MSSSSGDYARRSPRASRAEKWHLSTGDELELALRSAEHLLQQAEERKRHEQNHLFAIATVIAGTLLSLFASLVVAVDVVAFSSNALRTATTIFSVSAAAVVLAVSMRALIRQRREGMQDYSLRLATQISSMVGEAMLDVAEREKWSYLRIEVTKLRLSAFPLMERPRRFGDW